MSGLDILAKSQYKNQDNIIDVSPISIDVEIIKDNPSGLFGYETVENSSIIKSKAIIKYTPERVFLKNVGIFYENELPIIAFFKNKDEVQRGNKIRTLTRDTNTDNRVVNDTDKQYEEEFQVIDIKSRGYSQNLGKVYVLAPTRG